MILSISMSKLIVMERNIYLHTRKLIRNGIFYNFSDIQISRLYLALLSERYFKSSDALFQFWRMGEFTNCDKGIELLNATNIILQFYNQPTIHTTNLIKFVRY